MNNKYTVPIIPYNLSKQDTIIQIAEVLSHLSNVTDNLLQQIDNRINSNNNKLKEIFQRINKVNIKIGDLTGTKRATQVFSSSKYPASDVNKPYISIFNETKQIEINRHKIKSKKFTISEEPLNKLHIYHVKIKSTENKKTINDLGKISNDTEFVNDLLLYNSGKNLYTNFVLSNALELSQQIKEEDISNNLSIIGAAPYSISERSALIKSSTQTYFYTPNLGEVPALDVPLDLPDLPGIADDLRYEIELGPGIAPSVTATPNVPDVPVIEQFQNIETNISANTPLPEPEIIEEKSNENVTEIKTEDLPEPPPPPVESEEVTIVDLIPPLIQPTDARASLMEAIRKAGGSKNLKSTNLDKTKKAEESGNDLMADLHAKLSLRRKGISGAKNQDNFGNVDVSTTMEKISARIPPPVFTNDSTDNDNDTDWD